MNYQMLAPLLGEPLAAFIVNGENVLTKILDKEQLEFLAKNWQMLPVWLGTDAGREAARLVVSEWMSTTPRG